MDNAVCSPDSTGSRIQEETAILVEAVRCLKKQLGHHLLAVVLFGSRARGEATEASDWDILVVSEGLPERTLARYRFMKSCLPARWRGSISILAKTPSEFESALPPLYLDIACDGLILYDPAGYMQRKLCQVRLLIRKLGLVRQRRGQDIVWTWEAPPKAGWSLRWEEAHP